MTQEASIQKVSEILKSLGPKIVALSGGLDSLVLATLSHRADPGQTLVVHAKGPAVPKEATERVLILSKKERWNLRIIRTDEIKDEAYLSNPQDRCYFCKRHLYRALSGFRYSETDKMFLSVSPGKLEKSSCTLLSGANTDDLGEFRPGLLAAKEIGVRHPFVEAGISKEGIRAIARLLELPFAELPASPCLASRVYTGTRVTFDRLEAIQDAEHWFRQKTGTDVVRCRLNNRQMLVEVLENDRAKFSFSVFEEFKQNFLTLRSPFEEVLLDPKPYRPGRAFITATS